MEFNWRRYIARAYNTIYLLFLSMIIILMTHHPQLIKLATNDKQEMFLVSFLILSVISLVVRYLKKSNKLKPRAVIKT